jgi:hypothetical protein
MNLRPTPSARFRAFGRVLLSISALAILAPGCGGEVKKYEKKGPPSGKAAELPPVPRLPDKKKKDGDAYTVFGVVHDLHSKVHREEVNGQKLSLVGYIVKTNMVKCADDTKALEENCAPACAIHKGGKEDPQDCKAPVPTFWIADSKDEKTDMIAVMGWASNFAGIYDAIEEMDKATTLEKQKEVKFSDSFGKQLPNPLPSVGAKVKITGTYGQTFKGASSGTAADPKYGIMALEVLEYIEPAPEPANLPGMKDRKKLKDK